MSSMRELINRLETGETELQKCKAAKEGEPREGSVVVSKAGRQGQLSKPFHIRHRAGFGVCPAGFQSCFVPIFPYYASIPPFWNVNSALLYVE